jgi:hypothetical protein
MASFCRDVPASIIRFLVSREQVARPNPYLEDQARPLLLELPGMGDFHPLAQLKM